MADKPRLLVIERDARPTPDGPRRALPRSYEVVTARTMARALVLLRQQEFAGVYVDAAQLAAVRWAGVLIQADEILDAIADGVAVVDPDLRSSGQTPNSTRSPIPRSSRSAAILPRPRATPRSSGPTPARSPRLWRRSAREHGACGSAPTATCG